jgi:hypothetical protein
LSTPSPGLWGIQNPLLSGFAPGLGLKIIAQTVCQDLGGGRGGSGWGCLSPRSPHAARSADGNSQTNELANAGAPNGGPLADLSFETRRTIEVAVGRALRTYAALATPKIGVRQVFLAGGAFSLTAGIFGLLLRGGAILTTLLSSVSVMREIDPLVVVMRRKRRRSGKAPDSKIDLLFSKPGKGPGGDAETARLTT